MAEATLEFLKNDAGENEGLGDAGIETFKDDPYASCGREAGQNSRDAFASLPVRMTFDMLEVPTCEIPGEAELEAAVTSCLNAAKQEKDQDFFEQAEQILQESKVKILRIADYNTKGLAGPSDQEGTPFHSLLKGAGVSSKESDTSGGSFGIGKNASFAVSDLQTVFYSTVYKDAGGEEQFAAQGKVRLVSHVDGDGQKRRATGYWGNPDGYVAVTDRNDVPEWMRRTEVGTTIFSIGFREDKAWSRHIAYSLLSNFFYAVHRGDMVFEVDDSSIKINQNTVEPLFDDAEIRKAAENAGQTDALEFAKNLYTCLVSPETEVVEATIENLGTVRFHILVREGMPKRVGIVRNGMLITRSLEHFGDRLERFAGSKEFIALVEPVSDSASKLMKTLENPKHDSFSPHRISDPMKRSKAEIAMKKLKDELRKAIREHTSIIEQDEVILDELARLFAEPEPGDSPPDPNAELDPEKYVFEPPKRRSRRTLKPAPTTGEDGGSGKKPNEEVGGKPGRGPGAGEGTGGKGTKGTTPPIQLGGFRNRIAPDASADDARLVWFTPDKSGRVRLELEATGMNSSEPLTIVEASEGKASHGAVIHDVKEGERVQLRVKFDAGYAGPLEAVGALIEGEMAA
jgi:hypothetical protein